MRKALLLAASVAALAVSPRRPPTSAPRRAALRPADYRSSALRRSRLRRLTHQAGHDPDPCRGHVAKPKPEAGLEDRDQEGTLPQPVKDFNGNTVTTGVLQVTWTGGPLPDAYFDTFELRLGMPNTPGKTLYFKTIQRCIKGVDRWIEIPVRGQDEPEDPAPGVALVKSTGGHG